jgi:site-specific recombinase XerD
LNEQFIREFQEYVVIKCGLSVETVRHYLALLKRVCRIAFKEGHSDKYHFEHYTLPKKLEKPPRALSRENFEKLRDLEIEEHRWSHIITRDLFLFACYTGTSYIDVVSITKTNLVKDDSGTLWLKCVVFGFFGSYETFGDVHMLFGVVHHDADFLFGNSIL